MAKKSTTTIGAEDAARAARTMLAGEGNQAAVLMLALGETAAGEAIKYLSDAEIDGLVRQFAGLGKVTAQQKREAMAECMRLHQGGDLTGQAQRRQHSDFIFAALNRAVGPRRASDVCTAQGLPSFTRTPPPPYQRSQKNQKTSAALEKTLHTRSLSDMSPDELRDLIVTLAELARREGILAIEPLLPADCAGDKLLHTGLRLAVDGTEPDLIRKNLEVRLQTMLRDLELMGRLVIEGIAGIQAGDNPRLIEFQLESHYRV